MKQIMRRVVSKIYRSAGREDERWSTAWRRTSAFFKTCFWTFLVLHKYWTNVGVGSRRNEEHIQILQSNCCFDSSSSVMSTSTTCHCHPSRSTTTYKRCSPFSIPSASSPPACDDARVDSDPALTMHEWMTMTTTSSSSDAQVLRRTMHGNRGGDCLLRGPVQKISTTAGRGKLLTADRCFLFRDT
jgi:hypothetical protein